MKKHGLRGLSFFKRNENSEWLKENKKDMENTREKILKLISEEKEADPSGNSNGVPGLVTLVKDFCKCYESLYESYDHLTGELRKNVHHRDKTDGTSLSSSSSSSSSDSESEHVSEEKAGKKRKGKTGEQSISGLDYNDLAEALSAANGEKDALLSEKWEAFSKIQEAEKNIWELKTEAERLKDENLKLQAENGGLKLGMDSSVQQVADLNQRLAVANEEKDALILENSKALSKIQQMDEKIKDLESEVELLRGENSNLHVTVDSQRSKLESSYTEVANMEQRLQALSQRKESLASERVELLTRLQQAEKTIEGSGLEMGLLKDRILELQGENGSLKLELDAAIQGAADLKQTLEATNKEKNASIMENLTLLGKVEQAEKAVKEFKTETEQLKGDMSILQVKNEDLKRELHDTEEEKAMLLKRLQLGENQMNESENERIRLMGENSDLLQNRSELQNQVLDLERKLEERGVEVSAILKKLEDAENEASGLIKALQLQVNDLQLEPDSFDKQKSELEEQVKRKHSEVLENQLQMDNSSRELISKISKLRLVLREKEDKLEDLGTNYEKLEGQFQESCEKLQIAEKNIEETTEEREQTKSQLSELQMSYKKLEDQFLESCEKLQTAERNLEEITAQGERTKSELHNLLLESDLLKTQKKELEQEASENLIQMGIMLKEKEDNLNVVDASYKELYDQFQDSCAKLQIAEKKIEEMTEESKQTMSELNSLKLDLGLLRTQKSELEEQIERKNSELSTWQIQMENLSQEFAGKISDMQIMLKEKEEGLNGLNASYKQLDDELRRKIEKLQIVEKTIKEMEEEREQIKLRVNTLQVELDLACAQKKELEDLIESKNTEISESKTQMETLSSELTGKILDLERLLKQKEDSINDLKAGYKQLDDQFQESSEKLQIAEKKIGENAEESRMIIKSKDEMIHKLERLSDEQKKETETSGEEISRLMMEINKLKDNCKELQKNQDLSEAEMAKMKDLVRSKDEKIQMLQKIEGEQKEEIKTNQVQQRLLNQKLQITESEFKEKEENYQKIQKKLHDERELLEDRVLKSAEKTGLLEELKEIRGVVKTAMEGLSTGLHELKLTVHKFVENHKYVQMRLTDWSQELLVVKACAVTMINERQELKKEKQDLTERLKDTQGLTLVLQDKVGILEGKVSEKERERVELIRRVVEFEKRMREVVETIKVKEEELLSRNEEKREAIRQLCLWIEYYRENYDQLLTVLKRNQQQRR